MKKTDWKKTISEQKASGLSVARFCRERGLTDSAFGYWQRKLEGAESAGEFVRLDNGEVVPVELPGGRTIKIRRSDLPVVLEALCAA